MKNILQRLGHLILILWLSLSLLFMILLLLEGNPVSLYLDPRLDEAHIDAMKRSYGYDQPVVFQYIHYLLNLFKGEMGYSFSFKLPVSEVLPPRLGGTLMLGMSAYLMAAFLALGLLVMLNQRRSRVIAKSASLVQALSFATPSFLVGTLLMGLFAVKWRWFPLTGSQGLFANELAPWPLFLDRFHHHILPMTSMALPLTGLFATYINEQLQLLEESPFVLSARGRGISESRIFWNHKMRVLLPGIIQLAGIYLPSVVGGTLIIESIYGRDGMGSVLFEAVASRDYPLLLGGGIWTTMAVVIGYELADYLRALLSPTRPEP